MRTGSRKTFKHIMIVVLSNLASLVAGVFVGFVVPRIMSLESYGYYKTYSLYVHYATFLSLGIVDGIVLTHGAKDYGQLDREEFRGIFSVYLKTQIFFVLCLSVVSVFLSQSDYSFIILCVGLSILATNLKKT